MFDTIKVWFSRYFFIVMAWSIGVFFILIVKFFFWMPWLYYLNTGHWSVWIAAESIIKYWIAPIAIGLIIATPLTAQMWYQVTPGKPLKKFIWAFLFCAVVWFFDFALLIPWGRDMVPNLINWWDAKG